MGSGNLNQFLKFSLAHQRPEAFLVYKKSNPHFKDCSLLNY